MSGRNVEIDRQLLEDTRRAKALQAVHTRIHVKPLHAAPHQIGCDSQGMRIDISHGGRIDLIQSPGER
ncbi:hypothetical protein [Novosphingobium album (ex Liu et al. 2023)]|uniref:Uncharacterized protein n=1 Tax=Novosphingobium album (ex Liu et al. 2023) TaxID=3031130 RepID=A0ABT5WQ39_9SPHN|nr:hypothetical protein [Novosphingobium album (ex Liu et al. 2023)]MDE8652144.1 hypothetical protein [Novosphingobium album (ex Liu et al. 2023)]